ncbi:UDP-N-acetylmuramoyl-tripeptide--D-alanyl-D-alanine ligase [Rufibacter latericius]|uniref:UDP-N-acetylmuramoyl-tripeptide--D-alanyl-D-alanine ligase n=1 Tax=Rufibacter latericius TaxID=2487040 RepID=A0A3M9ML76_9BACT|nr:UDP-N-acetylmuramoyl-tripeptide--D-alanyl-D-alanine ligase [Rufibacter latericius]RNI25967.1 UDP-N-acetylmuramoyl-tripeptide--D-alanyl-D-alanine ligase [Rufibacter latericius]
MAELVEHLYQKYLECRKVSTDSRAEQDNTLFFALDGPNFKGSQFAQMALEKGARYAVVQDPTITGPNIIQVEDSLKALQSLALHHRLQLSIPFIGITGSNGKTTTKELINAVLSQKFNVLCTKGNLNNHIGVPLTLLSIQPEHELAIIEMGANHPGDIAELCSYALPTHGLITNIGKAHLEGFGSLEGVARTKSELYLHLDKAEGTVFVNTSNEHLMRMVRRITRKVTYYQPQDDYSAELLQAAPQVIYRAANGEEVHTHLMGSYNFENMMAAACIGQFFGVSHEQINAAIAGYVPTNNRSQIVQKDTNTILLDAYNANPSSMALSVSNFGQMAGAPKVVILGDMLELGQESEPEHRTLGEQLSQQNFAQVFLCGKEMRYAAEVNPDFRYFAEKSALVQWLTDHPVRNSHVLIKGSRGIGLETVVELL